ncbi:MAG: peptide-methionine (S)-S-oxide reductase [Deltaproteobacteria bacterium GWC2_56_8]|nr:MAG: peptide-methionine (S)-S-oxide reductase [Deltaproteobacteria bacterium GWB2_55_19]OGP37383.1 MAG: peptide-methionine (S)-S-oxide reductase [Deltaproteobacteria bacterium GWC2_56_8]HAO92291.1 peptide-methionine (S)-S-oxide reductase [Deltaproteobacteria bacterium]
MKTAKALFAAGCFWGVEEAFRKIKGVVSTRVGYTGGDTEAPSYEEVCTGLTGHAEAVLVEFDPATVSYETLIEVFWSIHDPTTLNKQGPDTGNQYRSAIFYFDKREERIARASKKRLEAIDFLKRPVVTEIVEAGPFYEAEEYHQRYLEKKGLSYR